MENLLRESDDVTSSRGHPLQKTPQLGAVAVSPRQPYPSGPMRNANWFMAAPTTTKAVAVVEPLTEREQEVLHYLASHLTLGQIGNAMYVSRNTVKTHVSRIYRKMGAYTRDGAVTAARMQGLL